MFRLQMKRKNSTWKLVKVFPTCVEALEERDVRRKRSSVTLYRVCDEFGSISEYEERNHETGRYEPVE